MIEFLSAIEKYLTTHVCGKYIEGCGHEPFNTVSNCSFLIAAFYARQLTVRQRFLTLEVSTAIALAVMVAIGSALFHYFAQVWAMWLDIIPIVVLQCWIVWQYSRQVMEFPAVASAGLLAVLVVGGFAGDLVPKDLNLNGSLSYVPALLILFGMAVWHWRHQKREPYVLLLATAAFSIALFFRTIDWESANVMRMGTHFLWHIFNGATVYCAIRCLIFNLPGTEPVARQQRHLGDSISPIVSSPGSR